MTAGRAPDFVGVGAQKSGTSWWYHLLESHPGCLNRPEHKEVHFFDSYWAQPFDAADVAAYHAKFTAPPTQLVGEWTPRYMYDPWVPPLLRRAAPDCRILVLLRDPVDRYISGLTHSLGHDDLPPSALVSVDAFHRGLYASQLVRLFEAFDRAQVLVLQYERCVSEPARELARTYEFVGLDPAFVPADLLVPVRETRTEKHSIPQHIRTSLVGSYADDLAALRSLGTDMDLGLWPTARTLGLT